MWPMLLNMTHDECRRTLRRLELEAYSNLVSVFRAQGALADNRKKLLEDLRAVLHISNDRHSAEARRVSNDEILATIAYQLSGPNTGIGWICEGRRKIPLMPRNIAQTCYTELADEAAKQVAAQNKELKKKLDMQKNAESQTEEMEDNLEEQDLKEEPVVLPVAMEDQTIKLWETELLNRKRKVPDGGGIQDEPITPIKNMRNIPANTNQKHLNLSQIYSKLSQPPSKTSGHSKHSYNQVSKVSNKSSQGHPRTTQKHRTPKQSKHTPQTSLSKSKKEMSLSPSKFNPVSMQLEYAAPPGSFQATYAQSVLGKPKSDNMSPSDVMTDSPTMQLLTQPATVPHELGVTDNMHYDDPTNLQAQGTPGPKHPNKPGHFIIKKRGEGSPNKKVQMTDVKVLQKPTENIKILSNRQVMVAPSPAHKGTPGKLVTTKVVSALPKSHTQAPVLNTDKMIVVSKPSSIDKHVPSPKFIITSPAVSTMNRDGTPLNTKIVTPKSVDALTPKGIPATDLKVSAKTLVLNPKSGQKMVVLPAKARSKPGAEGQVPLLHFKGLQTAMKLVSVSSQSFTQVSKQPIQVVSKSSVVPSNSKIVGIEPIKTANMADIVPVKGLTPVTAPKLTNPILRPASAKGNVIVVQKRATIGKALTFTKNGNDVSKIIMGKNVNELLQASKPEQSETAKSAGNVIVLELNNDQPGRPTTLSEILDNRSTSVSRMSNEDQKTIITPDTPVLFDTQMSEETCNASSLDSAPESIEDIVPMEESNFPVLENQDDDKTRKKESEINEVPTSVTDWEEELETVTRKEKDNDKLNSIHLDLGMSSGSEGEYMDSHKSKKKTQESLQEATPSGESNELYGGGSGLTLATRTLFSQLHDEGSSSNDSSFALKKKHKESAPKLDKVESDELSKVREKLSEKVAKSKRIDIYSTAITTSEINLDAFSYLEEGMMAGDDEFVGEEGKRESSRDDQLSRLLAEDSANSADSQPMS